MLSMGWGRVAGLIVAALAGALAAEVLHHSLMGQKIDSPGVGLSPGYQSKDRDVESYIEDGNDLGSAEAPGGAEWSTVSAASESRRLPRWLRVLADNAHASMETARPSGKRWRLAACAVTAWHDEPVLEWVIRHLVEGVQHFYLYEIDQDPEFSTVLGTLLRPLIDGGLVTLTVAEGPSYAQAHESMRQRCLQEHFDDAEWLVTLRTTEFVTMQRLDVAVADFLDGMDTHQAVCLARVAVCPPLRLQATGAASRAALAPNEDLWSVTAEVAYAGLKHESEPIVVVNTVHPASRIWKGVGGHGLGPPTEAAGETPTCVSERGLAFSAWHASVGVNTPLTAQTLVVADYAAHNSVMQILRQLRLAGSGSIAALKEHFSRCAAEGRVDMASLWKGSAVTSRLASYPQRYPSSARAAVLDLLGQVEEPDRCLAEARQALLAGKVFGHAAYVKQLNSTGSPLSLDPLAHWLFSGCEARAVWLDVKELPHNRRSASLLAPSVVWDPSLMTRVQGFPIEAPSPETDPVAFGERTALETAWEDGTLPKPAGG